MSEEDHLRKGAEHHRRITEAFNLLKPLIDDNIKHLERIEGLHIGDGEPFHTNPEDRPTIALTNVLASFVAHQVGWEVRKTFIVAFRVLEESNCHDEAHALKDYIEKHNAWVKDDGLWFK